MANEPPTAIMIVGLQGSGKTTTTGKLARWLSKNGHNPLMVSVDVYRPAARQQLSVIAARHQAAHLRRHAGGNQAARTGALGAARGGAERAATCCWSTPPAACTSTIS